MASPCMLAIRQRLLDTAGLTEQNVQALINQYLALSKRPLLQDKLDDVLLPESHADIRSARAHNLDLLSSNDALREQQAMNAQPVDMSDSVILVDHKVVEAPADPLAVQQSPSAGGEGGYQSDGDGDDEVDHDTLKDTHNSGYELRWQRKHAFHFAKAGRPWPPQPRECYSNEFPGIMELSLREYEIAVHLGFLRDHRSQTIDQHVVVDLSQTIERVSIPKQSAMVCVTPKGRLFSNSRMRLLNGEEKLRAQYMFFNEKRMSTSVAELSSALKGDLAGNAFCVSQFAPHMLALQGVLAMVHHIVFHGGSFSLPLGLDGPEAGAELMPSGTAVLTPTKSRRRWRFADLLQCTCLSVTLLLVFRSRLLE